MSFPPTAMYRVTYHDNLPTYSMDETPPVVFALTRRPEESALLKLYGYRLVEQRLDMRGGIYARGNWAWITHWIPVQAHKILWNALYFLYEHPVLGFKKGTSARIEIRLRDLRPFPFGHRIN